MDHPEDAPVSFIDNGGVALALERRGSGPRHLLFAHGWISSRRMWYDVVARLDPARFTSHLLDFRGAGLSDRPREGHDLDGYASDLRAAIAAVGEEVVVVAHSMGGKVAQFVATDAPPTLLRLVLVAPGTARGFAMDPKHRRLAEDAFGSRARIERFQRAAMIRPLPPATMERIVTDALVAQREAWFGWYDRGRTVDFADRLTRIAIPVAVISGGSDPLAPPARLRREVVEAIPGALAVTFRDVGHNLPVEAPEEIAGVLARLG